VHRGQGRLLDGVRDEVGAVEESVDHRPPPEQIDHRRTILWSEDEAGLVERGHRLHHLERSLTKDRPWLPVDRREGPTEELVGVDDRVHVRPCREQVAVEPAERRRRVWPLDELAVALGRDDADVTRQHLREVLRGRHRERIVASR
jgi:hypothetical protein